jgi:hypothetical protein
MWVAKRGWRRSVPVRETALRRVGDYRCQRRGTYCAQRIHAGQEIAAAGGWSRACTDRCGRWSARVVAWSRRAVAATRPRLNTAVTDRRSRSRAELEVRRVYEPNRLAAAYVAAAYAQVVPRRQRPARVSLSSTLTGVSSGADVRAEAVDARPRCVG